MRVNKERFDLARLWRKLPLVWQGPRPNRPRTGVDYVDATDALWEIRIPVTGDIGNPH